MKQRIVCRDGVCKDATDITKHLHEEDPVWRIEHELLLNHIQYNQIQL